MAEHRCIICGAPVNAKARITKRDARIAELEADCEADKKQARIDLDRIAELEAERQAWIDSYARAAKDAERHRGRIEELGARIEKALAVPTLNYHYSGPELLRVTPRAPDVVLADIRAALTPKDGE